jgi:hypothetical protein
MTIGDAQEPVVVIRDANVLLDDYHGGFIDDVRRID